MAQLFREPDLTWPTAQFEFWPRHLENHGRVCTTPHLPVCVHIFPFAQVAPYHGHLSVLAGECTPFRGAHPRLPCSQLPASLSSVQVPRAAPSQPAISRGQHPHTLWNRTSTTLCRGSVYHRPVWFKGRQRMTA